MRICTGEALRGVWIDIRRFNYVGGGGMDDSALRASPFGSSPAATLSRIRSNRTLVEASHPSPFGDKCGYVG